MQQKNRAAYMVDLGKMEMRELPVPTAKPGEVVLKVEYVGVCGSDVHFFETGVRKGKPFQLPFILGHECAGMVTEVGEGVKSIKVGDRVCFEPQITCGKCVYCRSGHYNMCPDVVFPSTPPYDGMLRDYAVIPAENAFKLPDEVSTKEGALIEPLAVGLSAAEKGEVTLGKTVVILGAGCIGLVTMMACKAMGASRVIMSDLYPKRLENALRLGADVVINASEEDTVQRVMELTDGEGADVVFEVASNPVTAAQTVDLVRRCGVVVMVGNINEKTPYRFMDLMYREGQIRTIYRYRNNFDTALRAVASGRIDISGIISHEFDFSDVQAAFDESMHNRQNVIKAVIKL
mgnify:FL=1